MTRQELVTSNINAWNNHDPEAFAANFAESGLYINPDFPNGIGVEALKDFMRKIFASSSDWKIELVNNIDTEGEQIGEWIVSGTNDGPNVDGSPATGQSFRVVGCSISELDSENKMVEHRVYIDRLAFRPAATAEPEPAAA